MSAFVVLIGISLVVPEFSLKNDVTLGIFLGIGSAITIAFRNVLNRKYVQNYDSSLMLFYQTAVAMIVTLPVWLIPRDFEITGSDLGYLIVLSVFVTSIGHTLFLRGFKIMTVRTAGVLATLEPIYATIMALILLGEMPGEKTLIGGAIILATVVFESLRLRKVAEKPIVAVE